MGQTAKNNQNQPGWILQPDQVLLGNYRVERFLGGGGMGQVFQAEDLGLGIKAAIKVPSLTILTSPDGPGGFLKEARIAARLHPNSHIVHIRACLTDPELRISTGIDEQEIAIPFIVMEYLGGGDLAQKIRAGLMPLEMVADFFDGMCQAVHHAHCHEYADDGIKVKGVIHRDLKPQNICFDTHGRLVVVDFGLARLLENPSCSGGITGTPGYMAPEQWVPSMGIDFQTDIYALGVVLFQMLAGRLPFQGKSLNDLMEAHLHQLPPDLLKLRPDLPPPVAEAVGKALQKEKQTRFTDAEQFNRAVIEFLRDPQRTHRPPTQRSQETAKEDSAGKLSAKTFLLRGDSLAQKGQHDQAIVEYSQCLHLNPREVRALINRGHSWHTKLKRAFVKRGFDQALADYTRALEIDPTNAEAWHNRGMVWKDMGEYDKAILDFEKALSFDPSHPLALDNLQDALEKRMRRTAN